MTSMKKGSRVEEVLQDMNTSEVKSNLPELENLGNIQHGMQKIDLS